MRSHPYTPAPPLPPLLSDLTDELFSILPNQTTHSRRRSSLPDIPLSDLDPDTSRLLAPPPPARRRQHHHHVRVQGRLALVRSVSTVNLHSQQMVGNTSPGAGVPVPPVPGYESAVGGAARTAGRRAAKGRSQRRRGSLDDKSDAGYETGNDDEERARETVIRDGQLRGYGIGGIGNIRRPTEVVQFGTSKRLSSLLLFSSVAPSSQKWNFREMFGLERRKKGKATSP